MLTYLRRGMRILSDHGVETIILAADRFFGNLAAAAFNGTFAGPLYADEPICPFPRTDQGPLTGRYPYKIDVTENEHVWGGIDEKSFPF